MAVNATPEYEKAEARYRSATAPQEELDALQEMLRLIPKHKASEKKQSDIKRRIKALRQDLAHSRAATTATTDPYYIPRGGAGQVAVVGLPNTGKSSILAAVTRAPVKVGEYAYTTSVPVPGMWPWQDAQIQLVDTPPFTPEHVEGGLVNLLHRADAVLVVVDAASPESLDQAESALAALAGKGIELLDVPEVEMPEETPNARPGLIAATHADVVGPDEIATLAELYAGPLKVVGVDCTGPEGLEALAGALWRLLHVIRVYTKRPGQKPDMEAPFTLPIGATVEELAASIHRDLPEKIKFARLWGPGRHDGQQVHRTETLHDRDVVELHE